VVTIDDVRELAITLPRSYEVLVADRVKFRVGRLVYLAFSPDEQIMGFAFPKDERDDLIAYEPEKFLPPRKSDLRYNWVHVRLPALGHEQMRELVVDAWTMVVPKSVALSHLGSHPTRASLKAERHRSYKMHDGVDIGGHEL
jgi:hypothetical protein